MRAAPAVAVTIPPDRLWRAAVAVLLLAALASSVAWACTASTPPLHWRGSLVLACLAWSAWLLWCEAKTPVLCLRWDGQGWHWREASSSLPEAPATLSVVADFGGWLLLRLRPATSGLPRRRWLAVSRRSLPSQWHALRCAVYSPTPLPPPGDTLPSGTNER